ncbi:MAG TPA: hypothetical protein VKB93_08405 [Thermoanaerobaculia bacterium]|nr:hypothetical protein [Thermoanaerobaculia bacterium]
MIYRKRGSVVRWENGTLIRVSESGVAVEEGELFTCAPEESSSRRVVESSRVMEVVRELRELGQFERLIVSEGIAEHECDGRTWSEETSRVHASFVNGPLRALVDSTTRRLGDFRRIAQALSRAEQHEREAPPRLVLARNVTAALLPSLVGLAPPNVELLQVAGGIDGRGHDIIEARDEWPNWYRPSYRVRPVRMPLNLRIRCDVKEIEPDRPVAVALLAPIEDLTLRVLVDEGTRAYPATVRVTRIDAVSDETIWYPYGGGSFGAEMML